MGASYSQTAVKIVNEAIVDVIIKTSQETAAYTEASQEVRLSGFTFGFSASQRAATSVKALQEVIIDQGMVEEITQKIKASAEAEGVMLNPAIANSEVDIRNTIATYLTNETFQKCVAKIKAAQEVSTSGVTIGAVVSQTSESLAKCEQLNNVSMQIARKIFTDVDAKSKSESKGLFEGLFGSEFMIMLGLALLLIVIAISIKVIMSARKKGRGKKSAKSKMRQPVPTAAKTMENALVSNMSEGQAAQYKSASDMMNASNQDRQVQTAERMMNFVDKNPELMKKLPVEKLGKIVARKLK